jgi:hypothetical protein
MNIIDEFFPNQNNDPSNYILVRTKRLSYKIFYIPDKTFLVFIDDSITRDKIVDYLLASSVQTFPGMDELRERYPDVL